MTKKKVSGERTAYHEAGHAVLYVKLGFHLKFVSIVPKDGYTGVCVCKAGSFLHRIGSGYFGAQAQRKAERFIMGGLAGGMAQRKFAPASVRRFHTSKDYYDNVTIAEKLCSNADEVDALIRLLEIRVKSHLDNPQTWRAVEAFASALLARHTIPGKEAEELILNTLDPGRAKFLRYWSNRPKPSAVS